MGTTLIFVGLVVCDGSRELSSPYWIGLASKWFQEIAPPYRPYPKPTQVVR